MKKTSLAIRTTAIWFGLLASAGATTFHVGPPQGQIQIVPITVPDGGATLVLFAIGLFALAALRRKLAK